MNRNLNMIPIQHQWARDAMKDMWANFWTPFEQSMGQDRAQLSELSPEELHAFKTTLALLTTADVQIGDNVGDGVTHFLNDVGLMDHPEIRGMLSWQEAQERLHTESYQHILESVLSLPEEEQREIYEMWQTEFTMEAKVDMARTATDTLQDPYENPENKYAWLFFYYCIYEGGWFMVNFNPIFAIHYVRRVMQGTVTQLQYIRRDESLHVAIGVRLLEQIELRMPGIRAAAMPEIIRLVGDAVTLENRYAEFALGSGFLGYTILQHMRHFHHLIKLRWQQAELPGEYLSSECVPWPGLANYELAREANFFESRVQEYQVGQLRWD